LPRYSLQKHPAMLERDLSVLPMFISCPGDFVVSDTSDTRFLDFWSDRFPCRMVQFGDRILRDASLGRYRPWGISPRSLYLARGLDFSPQYMDSPVSAFTERHRMLFSRESSVRLFGRMASSALYPGCCTPSEYLPCVVRDIAGARDFFERASACGGSVFKAVFGSSGRGVRILRNNLFTDNLQQWLQSVIKAHGSVECEYLFNKVCDFSMHYQIEGGKAGFVGVSSFNAAENGAYQSSLVRRLDSIPGFDALAADALAQLHVEALNDSIYTSHYCGPLGIDCMVYRHGENLMVNPCIEVNCRHSMGRLAMELQCLVDDGSTAQYHVYQKNAPLECFLEKPVFSNGKLVSGFLPLTPADTRMFAAGIYACR